MVTFGLMREVYPWETAREKPTSEADFALDDARRRFVRENVCPCRCELLYDPPPRPPIPDPLPEGDYYVEIIRSPPVRQECACRKYTKPTLPIHVQPLCLQYWAVPLRTVRSRTIMLRNTSVATTRWNACIRRWPRVPHRTLDTDRWAGAVRAPGIALQVTPARGTLAAGASAAVSLRVYADTWGVYYDQLLIQGVYYDELLIQVTPRASVLVFSVLVDGHSIEDDVRVYYDQLQMDHVDPIVLDVWVEAVGSPLQFALKPSAPAQPSPFASSPHAPCPAAATADFSDASPIIWMSAMDEQRRVRARNSSRSALTVHAYMLREQEREHNKYPLRLYLRLIHLPPGICSCYDTFLMPAEASCSGNSSLPPPIPDVGVELYIGEDHGPQDFIYYEVEPEVCEVSTGACAEWKVRARPEGPLVGPNVDPLAEPQPEPRHTLMLRLIPLDNAGDWWRRPEPNARTVRLRGVPREGQISLSISELRIDLCALDLPPKDSLRVRKRFRVQNTGAGWLHCSVRTADPWCVVVGAGERTCGAGCHDERIERRLDAQLDLHPRASNELCVEVCVVTREAWPAPAPAPWMARCSPPCAPPCGPMCVPPPRRPCPMRMYNDTITTTKTLSFYDDNSIIAELPLVLELYFPTIRLQPNVLDFGYVCAGDTRKSYFEVSHTSKTKTLELIVQWAGGDDFTLEPRRMRLPAQTTQRIYVQYTAQYLRGSPAEGWVVVQYAGAGVGRTGDGASAGAWCRAAAIVRAEPSRDYKCHLSVHDYTNDTHLLPRKAQ